MAEFSTDWQYEFESTKEKYKTPHFQISAHFWVAFVLKFVQMPIKLLQIIKVRSRSSSWSIFVWSNSGPIIVYVPTCIAMSKTVKTWMTLGRNSIDWILGGNVIINDIGHVVFVLRLTVYDSDDDVIMSLILMMLQVLMLLL